MKKYLSILMMMVSLVLSGCIVTPVPYDEGPGYYKETFYDVYYVCKPGGYENSLTVRRTGPTTYGSVIDEVIKHDYDLITIRGKWKVDHYDITHIENAGPNRESVFVEIHLRLY